MTEAVLSGWGRTAWSRSDVVVASSAEAARDSVLGCGSRGIIARGLGRAYGAAAQNAGGRVLEYRDDPTRPDHELDVSTGVLRAHAGTSIEEILRHSVPRGWFVPVTPGTRQVTLGGAVASDVHGKNHHVHGTFGAHVLAMSVLLSDGSIVRVGPDEHPSWFWATVGGMGLTGVVTEVDLQMTPIETPSMAVTTKRVEGISQMFEAMTADETDGPYSVAWIDLMATGKSLGRGVLTTGAHATRAETAVLRREPRYRDGTRLRAPSRVPNGLLNRGTIRAFNEFWYRRAPRRPTRTLESIPAFFHPLDGVRGWNHLYGRAGFVQYQFIVPTGREDAMERIVGEFSASGIGSFLAVLKKMGPQNDGMLSFPREGWTLALDLPAGSAKLPRVLHRVDEMVIEAGGRHYLAKDCHLLPWAVRAGYPRLDEWRRVRDEMDPSGAWTSDLARRLELVAPTGRGTVSHS